MTSLELLSVSVALTVVPIAALDPAVSGLVAWLAILLSGFSGVMLRSRLRYCILGIAISLLSVLALRIYNPAGTVNLEATVFSDVWLVMAIPLVVAALLIGIGIYRRRSSQ